MADKDLNGTGASGEYRERLAKYVLITLVIALAGGICL